eukprot:10683447-Alexandrium_andersonii.AAC.1
MASARRGPPVGRPARCSWRLRALADLLTAWSTVPPLALAMRSLAPSCAGGRKRSRLAGGRSSVSRLAADASGPAQSSSSARGVCLRWNGRRFP